MINSRQIYTTCPSCGSNCESGASNCPYCGATLVDIEIKTEHIKVHEFERPEDEALVDFDLDSVESRNQERLNRLGSSYDEKKEKRATVIITIVFLPLAIVLAPLLIPTIIIIAIVRGTTTKRTDTMTFIKKCPSCGANNPAAYLKCQYCKTSLVNISSEEYAGAVPANILMELTYKLVALIDKFLFKK